MALGCSLRAAVQAGNLELAAKEIQQGADVNYFDNDYRTRGWTPLLYAVQERNPQMVRLLIANGADVHFKAGRYRQTALFLACNDCRTEDDHSIVKLLLESGADCNIRHWLLGVPFLHALARCSSLEAVHLLIDYGADIRILDCFGANALHYAAKNPLVDMIEFVLDQGVDTEQCNEYGATALSVASRSGSPEVCESLLKRGAMVHKWTHGGYATITGDRVVRDIIVDRKLANTPLTFAVARNKHDPSSSVRIVEMLLKYGANVYDKCQGVSALKLTESHRCDKVGKLLIQKMVEMECLNLSIDEDDRLLIENKPTYKRYYDEYRGMCLHELQNMKNAKFYKNVSANRIVTGSKKEVSALARNEELIKALETEDYENKFPIYFAQFKKRFQDEVPKQRSRKIAARNLSNLFKFNDPIHPIIQKILYYSRYEDLSLLNTTL